MEKICTVTYHNVGMNYGQTLQAYALQAALRKYGYDSILLNYYTPFADYKYKGKLFFINRYAEAGAKSLFKQLRFDCFIHKNIKLTKLCFTTKEIRQILDDLKITHMICGSDQIWNPNGLDAVYFLQYGAESTSRRKIAYAASICSKDVMAKFKNKYPLYNKLIKDIDYVSIREKSGVEIVKEITGRDAEYVLDPTLLLNRKDWSKFIRRRAIRQKYMVLFFYGDIKPFLTKIETIAKINNITKIICLQTSEENYSKPGWSVKRNAGPMQFLNLLAHASAVCTDSFHGTAFSINLNRNFYCFGRSEEFTSGKQKVSNNSRITDLLELLEIKERWVDVQTDVSKIRKIDYKSLNKKLNNERKKSLNYLMKSLSQSKD